MTQKDWLGFNQDENNIFCKPARSNHFKQYFSYSLGTKTLYTPASIPIHLPTDPVFYLIIQTIVTTVDVFCWKTRWKILLYFVPANKQWALPLLLQAINLTPFSNQEWYIYSLSFLRFFFILFLFYVWDVFKLIPFRKQSDDNQPDTKKKKSDVIFFQCPKYIP